MPSPNDVVNLLDRAGPARDSVSEYERVDGPALRALTREAGGARIAEQLVSFIAPGSFAADQYRTLRHGIERARKDAGFQVLAITSSGPGEGKSVTALNLAGALAQSPHARVLIIDADLRRPSVARYLALGGPRSHGLVQAIQNGDGELADFVRRVDAFNLAVLPAGAPQTAPYELLNSPRLEALLAEARRQYDYVLIDTPPLVPFPDCRLVGRWVDGFLLIVAAHRTARRLFAEALNLIDPAKVVGVVFNGDDRAVSSHYGYYYRPDGADHRRRWWRRTP
jgi:protein-tyrosine kinase